ncbi:hypothetical protein [Myceligenerans pegani]|uniref:Alanine-rich protein n=1 Tax=Myceligenerans pegani TaxID=2776917 RepID=A0ABR9N3E8_9MICO|nr:hypothetical protein [Myceligenerans sp. TRM 65318]MBE1877628.1 hypothetical protein [Myceligenerans sp. TRM 65318]MBE3019899.1 hypothetical protein [Myceligenerans sp. TRM 65318]
MTTTFCAYPWDLLDDPRATGRVTEAGADGVVIAAAYHSVRAATPMHPHRALVDATDAAYYLSLDERIWDGAALRPTTATPWAGQDAFPRAAAVARAAGLRVEAWVVLTHSAYVGSRHPRLTVRNAYGERYPYALCPSAPEVRDYARRVVEGVVRAADPDGLMIEACGPLGVGHVGRHEKTQGADWSPVAENLLSICFCDACRKRLHGSGTDVGRLRDEVRAGLAAESAGRHGTMEDHLTDAPQVLGTRAQVRQALASAVREAAAAVPRVVAHAQPDPWATGPFAALFEDAHLFDGIVVPGDLVTAGGATAADLRAAVPAAEVGGYFVALPPTTPAAVADTWPRAIAGLDAAYLYHLGLLSAERLTAVGTAVERAGALRTRARTPPLGG